MWDVNIWLSALLSTCALSIRFRFKKLKSYELAESGINNQIALTLIASVVMACIVPIYTFFILKIKLDSANAAAIAAAYGSISAVTFITASSFLEKLHISYGGHMVAALALMESPAIVVGLILVRVFKEKNGEEEAFSWSKVLHEAFLNGSVFLLVGSVVVGMLTGEKGWEKLEPFTQEIFYGALTFFLLDMGLVAIILPFQLILNPIRDWNFLLSILVYLLILFQLILNPIRDWNYCFSPNIPPLTRVPINLKPY